jgi:2-keto-4-pentenoate hydratase/2-oxohepta-3-ene-1,7-dioic acid hydratase in catechol pathway
VRYLTVEVDGRARVAVAADGGLRAVRGGANRTLSELLALPAQEREAALAPDGDLPVDARVLAPLRPASIVCIGLNYLDHVRETGMERPKRPLVFSKLRSSVIGPGDAIRINPEITTQVDWEVELAVVIGREAQQLPVEEALDVVFGYTAANDVSARDVQFGDGQWVRGKSLDTFCPLGPAVVTRDEVLDPQRMALRTRVNGETVQDSNTAEMIFSVAELISFCSHSFTLLPGDVLLTGTPWGCGAFADPPRYLGGGDVVEVEVEGIGTLTNPVEALSIGSARAEHVGADSF